MFDQSPRVGREPIVAVAADRTGRQAGQQPEQLYPEWMCQPPVTPDSNPVIRPSICTPSLRSAMPTRPRTILPPR